MDKNKVIKTKEMVFTVDDVVSWLKRYKVEPTEENINKFVEEFDWYYMLASLDEDSKDYFREFMDENKDIFE